MDIENLLQGILATGRARIDRLGTGGWVAECASNVANGYGSLLDERHLGDHSSIDSYSHD